MRFSIPLPLSYCKTAFCEWPLILSDCIDPYSQTEQNCSQNIHQTESAFQAHSLYMTHDPTGIPPNTSQECPLWFTWEPLWWKKAIFRKRSPPFMKFFCRSLFLFPLKACQVATMEGTVVCGPFYRLWLLIVHVTPPSKSAFGWVDSNDVIMKPWHGVWVVGVVHSQRFSFSLHLSKEPTQR